MSKKKKVAQNPANYYKPRDPIDGCALLRVWHIYRYDRKLHGPDGPKIGDTIDLGYPWAREKSNVIVAIRGIPWSNSCTSGINKGKDYYFISVWLGYYLGYGEVNDPDAPNGTRPIFRTNKSATIFAETCYLEISKVKRAEHAGKT